MAQRRAVNSRRQRSVDIPRYPPQSLSISQNNGNLATHNSIAQQLPIVSDYDSDYQAYLSDYPSKPPPATRTNDELNMSVLRRHNADITAIFSIAPYAVIYEFQPIPEPTWSKTGIEGSLFICQMTPGEYGEDRYTAIVLNRRGLDNFEAELREDESAGVEITDEYVIISFRQGHEQKIYGVFIFSEGSGTSTEQTRVLNAELMKSLAIQAGLSRQAAEAAAAEATSRHTAGHIHQAGAAIENEQPAAQMERQTSLQQHFGQQRAEDASWSLRAHNVDGVGDLTHQHHALAQRNYTQPQDYQSTPQHQPNVLADLFRRAGIGAR